MSYSDIKHFSLVVYLQVVGSMLASEESDFEEELQGLTSSLDLLATLLSHFPHSHAQVKPLVQKIFGYV